MTQNKSFSIHVLLCLYKLGFYTKRNLTFEFVHALYFLLLLPKETTIVIKEVIAL